MPENTTNNKVAGVGPAWTPASPDAINKQEAEGQQQIIAEGGSQLPTEMNGCTEEQLLELGFTLGALKVDDPKFRYGGLPSGWKIVGTDHDMHSNILDEKNRKRGGIFYKAAFYERQAHISLACRYNQGMLYGGVKEPGNEHLASGESQYIITDLEVERQIIWKGEIIMPDGYDSDINNKAHQELNEALKAYPDYQNPIAYWS